MFCFLIRSDYVWACRLKMEHNQTDKNIISPTSPKLVYSNSCGNGSVISIHASQLKVASTRYASAYASNRQKSSSKRQASSLNSAYSSLFLIKYLKSQQKHWACRYTPRSIFCGFWVGLGNAGARWRPADSRRRFLSAGSGVRSGCLRFWRAVVPCRVAGNACGR